MMKLNKFLLMILILLCVGGSAQTSSPVIYGQVLIHTADGGTYIVTGNMSSFVYKGLSSGDFVGCMQLEGAVGLPPANNDEIFKNGFEEIALCFE